MKCQNISNDIYQAIDNISQSLMTKNVRHFDRDSGA